MKLKQVIDIATALSSIATAKLPAKASYRIAKAINLLRPEVTTFEEQRVKLAKELGTLSEDGAVGLLVSAPTGGSLAAVLERSKGFRETNRVFFRELPP